MLAAVAVADVALAAAAATVFATAGLITDKRLIPLVGIRVKKNQFN